MTIKEIFFSNFPLKVNKQCSFTVKGPHILRFFKHGKFESIPHGRTYGISTYENQLTFWCERYWE